MKIFKSIAITPELRFALDQARAALNKRSELDRAVRLNHEALSAATISVEELTTEAASLDAAAAQAEAAASIDPARKSDVAKANKAADAVAASLEGKHREIGRRTGAHELLVSQARASDEDVVSAKSEINQALAGVRSQLLDALAKDLSTACKQLSETMQAARVINAAMPNALNLGRFIDSVKVIDPRTFRPTSSDDHPSFSGTDLLHVTSGSAELPAETQDVLQEIADINKALAAHRPFVPPAKIVNHAPARAEEPWEAEKRRKTEENMARIDAYQPPPSVWAPNSSRH